MSSFRMRGHSALALAAALSLAGCTRWQLETSPREVVPTRPKAVRAEQADGSVVELVRVEMINDSLTGLVPRSAPGGVPLRRVTVPLEDITRMASQRNDTRRTVIAVLAGPLAYLASSFIMRW